MGLCLVASASIRAEDAVLVPATADSPVGESASVGVTAELAVTATNGAAADASVQEPPAPTPEATANSVAADALARAEDGQPEAAMATLIEALATWPDHPDLLRTRGTLERRRGDNPAAIKTYEQLLALDPNDALAPAVLALLLREEAKKADPETRFVLLTRVLDLAGTDDTVAVELTVAAAQAGNAEAAVRAYETLPDARRRGVALLRAAADSYHALGLDTFAAPLYGALLEAAPQDAALAEALARSLIRADRDTAPSRMDALLLRFPDHPALLKLRLQLDAPDADPWRRLRILTRLQTLDPTDVECAVQRAELLLNLGCVSLAQAITAPHAEQLSDAWRQALEQRAQLQRDGWAALPPLETPEQPYATRLLSLAYGPVGPVNAPDAEAFTVRTLVEQLEYLRAQGFTVVDAPAVVNARRGRQGLPPKAVLLVFERAHRSFEEQVLPLLEQYGYGCLLAVASGEIPEDGQEPSARLLTWDQLRDLAARPGVALASMTHSLGAHVQSNPQGRLDLSSISRRYTPATKRYETLEEYGERVLGDLRRSQATLEERTGRYVDLLIWPDGQFNAVILAKAREANFEIFFARQDAGQARHDSILPLTPAAHPLEPFAARVARGGLPINPPAHVSVAMPMDLSPLATLPPPAVAAQLEAMVNRAVDSGVDTVYLAAGIDDDDDGMIDAAFFPNRVLPVRADLLSHAVNLLRFKGLQVFIAMPTLNIRPGGQPPGPNSLVMEFRSGQARPSMYGRQRLSPFDPPSRQAVNDLYKDLASYVTFDGILFGLDLHLSDREDFSPEASRILRERLNIHERSPEPMTPVERARWAEVKGSAIESLVAEVRASVKALQPAARYARSLYASVITSTQPLERYAQHYPSAVAAYDYVWVDATPHLYSPGNPQAWLLDVITTAGRTPGGLDKTIFSLGLHHKNNPVGLPRAEWLSRLQLLRDADIQHVAYHPDLGPSENQPKLKVVQDMVQAARAGTSPEGARPVPGEGR